MGPGVGCWGDGGVLFGLLSWGKLPKNKGGEQEILKKTSENVSPLRKKVGDENFEQNLEDGFGPEYLFLSDFGPETYSKVEMLL